MLCGVVPFRIMWYYVLIWFVVSYDIKYEVLKYLKVDHLMQ